MAFSKRDFVFREQQLVRDTYGAVLLAKLGLNDEEIRTVYQYNTHLVSDPIFDRCPSRGIFLSKGHSKWENLQMPTETADGPSILITNRGVRELKKGESIKVQHLDGFVEYSDK